MQIAYLLLVHHQPKHFARLIRALDAPWAHFFIHVDEAADLSEFTSRVPEGPNVHYVRDRVRAYWGGFNVVRATLDLLRESTTCGPEFKYHVLLSGSDYPIKTNQAIHDFLNSSSLQHLSISDEILLSYPERIRRYWYNDYVFLNPRLDLYVKPNTLAAILLKGLAPQFRRAIQLLLLALPERKPPCFVHYQGSHWWALTKDCVDYILKFLEGHREYVSFHKNTYIPAEHFFHSIVMSSPYAGSISHRGNVRSNHEGLHYIEWSFPTTSPNVLSEESMRSMVSTEALFARKFDEIKSSKLLDSIDRHRS